jgi:hypothetical protein
MIPASHGGVERQIRLDFLLDKPICDSFFVSRQRIGRIPAWPIDILYHVYRFHGLDLSNRDMSLG